MTHTAPWRRLALGALAVLAGLGVTACGAKVNRINPDPADNQSISLELEGTSPSPEDVGIYEAQADGEFRRAGLDVHIVTAPAGANPIDQVATDKVNVGITSEPELMIQRLQTNHLGTVLGFGAVNQKPQTSLVSLNSARVGSFAGLKGKTVGLTGTPADGQLLTAALAAAGVPDGSVKRVSVSATDPVRALTGKHVAAVLGNPTSLTAALRRHHDKPAVVSITQSGMPTFQSLVFTSSELYFENHVTELRRFVQAVGRGYDAVRQNPAAGVRALRAANSELTAKAATQAVHQTLSSAFPAGGYSWGWMFKPQWNTFGKWLVAKKVLNHPSWFDASTNQLLAGFGP